jgi:hypothetical protein
MAEASSMDGKDTKFWMKDLKGRDDLGELVVNGRTIITRILKKYGVKLSGLDSPDSP